MKTFCWLFLALPLMTSCASTYKPIRPNATYYGNSETLGDITFSYKQGVLTETHNKKYAKREARTALKVVAVKIVNKSDQPLVIGDSQRISFVALLSAVTPQPLVIQGGNVIDLSNSKPISVDIQGGRGIPPISKILLQTVVQL
jgi:hypothetical protein